jgi:hypothetical protein
MFVNGLGEKSCGCSDSELCGAPAALNYRIQERE